VNNVTCKISGSQDGAIFRVELPLPQT